MDGSVAGGFVVLLVGFFIVILFYNIFTEPIEIAYNNTYDLLKNETSQNLYNTLSSFWQYFIVIILIGFVIAGFALSQRSSDREAYY